MGHDIFFHIERLGEGKKVVASRLTVDFLKRKSYEREQIEVNKTFHTSQITKIKQASLRRGILFRTLKGVVDV
jgi:hypothetical protein